MFPCPKCKEIIRVDNTNCRYCGAEIDKTTARRLNHDFQRVTDAVATANTFKQSIWLAVLLMIAAPVIFLILRTDDTRYVLISVAPIGFVGYAVSWLRKYGRLETSDMDYPSAVRDMRRSLLLWSVALGIHVAVLGYAFSWGGFAL